MTDTIPDSDWDAGFEFPSALVADPPATVTGTVIAGDTDGVTPPATGTVTGGAIPGVGDRATARPVTGDPIGAGHWHVPDGEDDRDGGLASALARLAGLAMASPLLGGGSLAAEVAAPRPGTWGQHWRHVTRHPDLPDGTWGAVGFVAGHLLVTGSLKLAGKAMTVTGNALTWTGTRADRASDNFASATILIVLVVAIVVIIAVAVGQAASYLA